MLAPVMEALSEELEGKAEFVKIDVDDNPDLAREYSIMSIPCVMVFKGGELAGKNVGFVPKAAMKEFHRKESVNRTVCEGGGPRIARPPSLFLLLSGGDDRIISGGA